MVLEVVDFFGLHGPEIDLLAPFPPEPGQVFVL